MSIPVSYSPIGKAYLYLNQWFKGEMNLTSEDAKHLLCHHAMA